MSHSEALDKVRKLLRLAQSSNPHEAALAASRAQEIIDRHKLESLALNDDGTEPASNEPISDFSADPLESNRARWKDWLAMTIAKQNQCKAYCGANGLSLIGRAPDVMTVRYVYGWLFREIDRLATIHCHGFGRTYWNNFRLGAVETVTKRLEEQGRQTLEDVRQEARAKDLSHGEGWELFAHSDRGALVLVEKAIICREKQMQDVEAWTKQKFPNMTKGRSSATRYNQNAREAGRQAGHSIGLRPAAGRLQ